MFTRSFIVASFERAAKSAAQFMLAGIGQDVLGVDLYGADLANVAAAGLTGFVISLLTSVASSSVGDSPSPSLAPDAEVAAAVEVG